MPRPAQNQWFLTLLGSELGKRDTKESIQILFYKVSSRLQAPLLVPHPDKYHPAPPRWPQTHRRRRHGISSTLRTLGGRVAVCRTKVRTGEILSSVGHRRVSGHPSLRCGSNPRALDKTGNIVVHGLWSPGRAAAWPPTVRAGCVGTRPTGRLPARLS